MQSLGGAFDGRRNSLNVIRLGLASAVIVSHSFALGQYGEEPRLGNVTIGTLAVAAFFAISGFLITRSREKAASGRYLWHRALRILPGYYVCLLVIAGLIAPLAWLHIYGTLSGYSVADSARYVFGNLALKTTFVPTIPDSQVGIDPSLQYWNGAAWSLFFEFLCYLLVAVLAAVGLLRVRGMLFVWLVGSGLLLAWELLPGPMVDLLFRSHDAYRLFTTGTVFAAGSLLYMLRDRVPFNGPLALAAALITTVGLLTLDRPEWLISVPMAYLVLWLAIWLPMSGWIKKTDISYGVYIYAYPVATLLTIYGVNEIGFVPYTVLTFAIVMPIALASWFVIEKRALRLKDLGLNRRETGQARKTEPRPESAVPN